MPINQWTSNGSGNNYYKLSGGAVTPYVSGQTATVYAAPFSGWAKLLTTPTSAGDTIAQYMWYQSVVDPVKALTGETVYFARESDFTFAALTEADSLAFSLDVGADNAYLAKLTVTPYIAAAQQAPQIFNFPDGNMDISYSNTEVAAPFNWQDIYHYGGEISAAVGVSRLNVKLEFKVVNYQQPLGNIFTNPGMLQYVFNLQTFAGTTETANVPNAANNPLL